MSGTPRARGAAAAAHAAIAAAPPPRELLAALVVGRRLDAQEAFGALGVAIDAAIAGARLVDIADDVGLSALFELDGVAIRVEIAPAASGRPAAVTSGPFALSWHAHGLADDGRGLRLCAAVAVVISAAQRTAGTAVGDVGTSDAGDGRGLRLRRGGPLLSRVTVGEEAFDALSPYVGCSIGCRFCYAGERAGAWWQHRHGPAPWGSWVEARVDAAEQLRAELVDRPPLPIKLTPIASDPWIGLERQLRLTRGCLDVIAAAPVAVPVVALTRSPNVLDDLATLEALPLAWVGVSLPTIDDDVRRHFEPRAASVEARLASLDALRARGVRTFVVVQPMLPGPIPALADAIAARCASASLDILRGVHGAAADFRGPFAIAASADWQATRLHALAEALAARGVVRWRGELPPDLAHAQAALARPSQR